MTTLYQNTLAWFNQLTDTNLAVIGIAATVAVVWFCLNQRQLRRLKQKLERMERDLRVANSGAIAMGQNIIALEKQVKQAVLTSKDTTTIAAEVTAELKAAPQEQFDNPVAPEASSEENPETGFNFSAILNQENANAEMANENSNNESGNAAESNYDKARHYLAKGHSVNEVSKMCGLSYAEVSLLQALGKHSIASE